MINLLLAIELAIGIGASFSNDHGINGVEENPIGIFSIRQHVTNKLFVEVYHESSLVDGFHKSANDRNYISIMYKFKLGD